MAVRLVLALVAGLLLFLAPGGEDLWADPDQCVELVTDYSLGCAAGTDRCGAYCFYAECLDCQDAAHRDHGSHHHAETCCGPDICTTETTCTECTEGDPPDCEAVCTGVTACVPDCWDCSYSHQDHGSHDYEVSPCIVWSWHLYGEPDGHRFDTFNSPNLSDALTLTVQPGPTQCEDEDGVVGSMAPGPTRASFDPDAAGSYRGGRNERGPVELSDLGGLAVMEGGEGAPVLDEVEVLGTRMVRLAVSGEVGEGLQYRYWWYDGFVPSEIRAPFLALLGDVGVGAPGIYSFQVRSVDSEGTPSLGSNVVHQLMDGEHLADSDWSSVAHLGTPVVPAMTPLPTLVSGLRPAGPEIGGVATADPAVNGRVEVTLTGGYAGSVEYRWWRHSGFGPQVGESVWTPVVPVGEKFSIDGLPVVVRSGKGLPALFDFQVRSVDADGVSSQPSDVVVLMVWGVP